MACGLLLLSSRSCFDCFHKKNICSLLAEATLEGKASGTCLPNDDEFALPFETVNYAEHLGLYEPYSKVYVTVSPMNNIPLCIAMFTINQIHKLTYSKSLGMCKIKSGKHILQETKCLSAVHFLVMAYT